MATGRMVGTVWVCALAFVACEEGGGLPTDDGGPPPASLEECFVGAFFAECGGTGPAVLGCDRNADCRWFSHGNAPPAYDLSRCPAGDVCCAADWPFVTPSGHDDRVAQDLMAWGMREWTRSRASVLTVEVVGAAIEPGTTVTCDTRIEAESGVVPCGPDAPLEVVLHDTVLLLLGRPSIDRLAGFRLGIELVPEGGAVHARACKLRFSDALTFQCGAQFQEPDCATAGAIRISHLPADVGGAAAIAVDGEVLFADGAWMRINR